MTLSVLKALYKKQSPRRVSYRNYNISKEYLKLNLEKINTSEFSLQDFQDSGLSVLICFMPLKRTMQEPAKLHL